MKTYVIVTEADTCRGYETTVSETGHINIETARIELVEKLNDIKANPIPYFGFAWKKDIRTTWTTDRMVNVKDSFTGNTIHIYIHEINIPEP